ncbi:hypothetical protein [Henriciella aquimarina]|uniref:hypothetical protein n=1 Tax=Henriciella aquimarina TaxID=545261 RepID=UPI0009FCA490|nr:hypothetical protein [Henriciella aquimarina]
MTRKTKDLSKLVALKRQKAEQDFAALQAEIRRDEQALAALRDRLNAADDQAAGYEAISLAHTHGHLGAVIGQMRTLEKEMAEKEERLGTFREALKNVLYSEQRLPDLKAGPGRG